MTTLKSRTGNFLMLVLLFLFGAVNAPSQTSEPRTTPVGVGETAPDFTLSDQNGNRIKLSAARGNAPVVLVFYRGYW